MSNEHSRIWQATLSALVVGGTSGRLDPAISAVAVACLTAPVAFALWSLALEGVRLRRDVDALDLSLAVWFRSCTHTWRRSTW